MKKYRLVIISFLLACGFLSCEEKDIDKIASPNQLDIGAYIAIDKLNGNEFNFASISTSTIGADVHGVGESITKIISYASTNNSTTASTWKKIKETPVADNKATISISGAELAAALGIAPTALSPGNSYTIYNEVITASGKKYNINNTNSEFESAPDFKMAFRLAATITCPFVATGFPGNFMVITDGWNDYNPGSTITVTAATATTITMIAYPNPLPPGGGNAATRQPITITIDPANGRATIATAQPYGDYFSATTYYVKTSTAKTSYVFSCSGDVILNLQHLANGTADQGTYLLKLKKI